LADHELYVADFYLKKQHPQAAASRLEGLVRGDFLPRLPNEAAGASGRLGQVAKDYLRTHLEGQGLLQLARTERAMGKFDEAQKSCERILSLHPGEPQAPKAQELLRDIERDRAAGAGKK